MLKFAPFRQDWSPGRHGPVSAAALSSTPQAAVAGPGFRRRFYPQLPSHSTMKAWRTYVEELSLILAWPLSTDGKRLCPFVVVVVTVNLLMQQIYDYYYVAWTRPSGIAELRGMGPGLRALPGGSTGRSRLPGSWRRPERCG